MTNRHNDPIQPKKKRWKTVLLIIGIILFCLLASLVISFLILRRVGQSQLHSQGIIPQNAPQDAFEYDDDSFIYNGVSYRFNEDVTTVLCMGVDVPEFTKHKEYGNSGQADAVFLAVLDTDTGKATVLALPRDAMAEIDIYSASGSYIGTQQKQLCVAYAYGDGRDTSCQCMMNAASRLLYGMPIHSYFAINYNGIGKLNDKVGGITVVPNETFSYGKATTFQKGESVHLTGSLTKKYLQSRNQESKNASSLRLARQVDYLKKYASAAIKKTKKDITFPISLYNTIKKEAVTDLNISKITYLTSALFENRKDVKVDFKSIPGTVTVGEDKHVEFYPDEDALYDIIIDLFYEPTKE